jgi:hypothetical protein
VVPPKLTTTDVRFRWYRGQDRASEQSGQRQIAAAANKGPSKLVVVDAAPMLKRPLSSVAEFKNFGSRVIGGSLFRTFRDFRCD